MINGTLGAPLASLVAITAEGRKLWVGGHTLAASLSTLACPLPHKSGFPHRAYYAYLSFLAAPLSAPFSA